jgi:hypothetical protein
VDTLEKLNGQISGIHAEISALSKKSPNDAVNKFKLKFINAAITACNGLLGDAYRAVGEFTKFNPDDVPSNSDVTLITSLYLEALEKFRSDHIKYVSGWWYYNTSDGKDVRSSPPAKLKE